MNKKLAILALVLPLGGAALAMPFVAARSPQVPVQNPPAPQSSPEIPTHPVLGVVVLDPAHGGIDTGARGGGGIRESEVVLNFAGQIRSVLERAGSPGILTRETNHNPSFAEPARTANP